MTISSLYRRLFGRSGPSIGTDIDMSEHGRVGGISSNQGFKWTRSVSESLRLGEDSEDPNISYVGKAPIGSAEDEEVWQIMKLNETSGVEITWAGGTDNYDYKWDDRETLSYS